MPACGLLILQADDLAMHFVANNCGGFTGFSQKHDNRKELRVADLGESFPLKTKPTNLEKIFAHTMFRTARYMAAIPYLSMVR